MAFGGDGSLWVLEKKRLRKWKNGEWIAEAKPWDLELSVPLDPSQFELHADAQGNAWLISNGNGLWHITSAGVVHHLTETNGLPSSSITCWFQDREGDVWIGTAGGGIARIRESIFRVFGVEQGLPGNVVRSVCVDNTGTPWVGTLSGGLAMLRDGRFTRVPFPSDIPDPIKSLTVAPDQTNGIWVGSLTRGVMRLESGKITATDFGNSVGNTIRILFVDRKNQLWIGGLVDLCRASDDHVEWIDAADGFVDHHAIGAMTEDANGIIWIGTGPGELWKYDGTRFTCFTPPSAWPSVRISALLADTNGVVWVGTLGGGLLRFQDGKFNRFTTENRLPDNNISQLLDSHDGYLWAGTYAGIFRVSKADLEAIAAGKESRASCRVYGRYDGLPSLECSSGFQPSCWQANDGQLWFATANGVVSVDPLKISPNRVPPVVLIEEMLIDGVPQTLQIKSQSSSPEPKNLPVRIEPGRHYVQFRFTGLNFTAPDGVRFRVKLEGGDDEWHSTGSNRLMGYGPLLPGKYRFHVIACNNDGVWNNTGATLSFTVQPFFWQTWVFKALLAMGTLTTLGILVATAQRRRYRRKLERVERQREMERERTRIARDLHDDLGTSLTQISLLSAMANREKTPANESKDLIQQVRERARAMVIALDEIVWAVNPKNDSLAGLVGYLGHFAEEFYKPTGIRYRQEIPLNPPDSSIPAESRHHLFLAFKEAVNNVARHSGATEVQVRIEIVDHEVIIQVKDNGCGFEKLPPAAPHLEDGLENMRQRMEQIGGTVSVASTPGTGTTVTFRAPFGQA